MRTKSELTSKKVKIVNGDLKDKEILIEDWWENVGGGSWMLAKGNPACLKYAMRTGLQKFSVPTDDEVLYGKIGGIGELVHLSELEEIK